MGLLLIIGIIAISIIVVSILCLVTICCYFKMKDSRRADGIAYAQLDESARV